MAGRLAGKTAFITAAGQGMGRAAALAFTREGAKVWASDMNAKTVGELDGKDGIRARALPAGDASGAMKNLESEFNDRRTLVSVAKIWQAMLGQCCLPSRGSWAVAAGGLPGLATGRCRRGNERCARHRGDAC